jgi:hypothetical protein
MYISFQILLSSLSIIPSSNHPKPGLVKVFEGACPKSLQIAQKLPLRARGNSEQQNKVLKAL